MAYCGAQFTNSQMEKTFVMDVIHCMKNKTEEKMSMADLYDFALCSIKI